MAIRSRSKPAPAASSDSVAEAQRLQKVLAAAGISSRRECEELIRDGRVEVDRQVVTELGTRVDPARQEIRVDGVVLPRPKLVYYALNKPAGVVSTNRDPDGRARVIDLIPSEQRLFPVGRLDRSSEGLILVTNDGELANQLTHPRYGVEKTYAVRVAGDIAVETLKALRKGIRLAEGVARVTSVRVKKRHKQSTDLEIVLREGRNREIRRILAQVGHKVLKLTRIAMGTLRLGELPTGAYRPLSHQEIRALRNCVRTERTERNTGQSRSRGSRENPRQFKSSKPPSAGKSKPPTSPPGQGSILAYDEETPAPAVGERKRRWSKGSPDQSSRRGGRKER